jgi:DNA-binding SARP family transcriptional activator/tetratricopeptide (TPR) repeat protein
MADRRLVRLGVLGPLVVARDDSSVPLPNSTLLRSLFGALLLARGEPLDVSRLADIVWVDPTSPGTVHVAMSRLRDWLRTGPAGRPAVIRRGGYLLDLAGCSLDVDEFASLAAGATGPDEFANLHAALALRRGEVLQGLNLPGGHGLIADVDAMVRRAANRYARLAATSGRPHDAVPTLDRLAEAWPLDEVVNTGLIEALAAAGRPAEAIWRFEQVRVRLAEEIGVDPSPELRAAYLDVLRSSVEVEPASRHDARPSEPPGVRPRQLPADIRDFVGRDHHLQTMRAWLGPHEPSPANSERPAAKVIAAIVGPGGIGKSALALHWAHMVADRFPDGQLYVNLRGFDPSGRVVSPSDAVRGFLDALGVPAGQIPTEPDAQAGLYRSLLADRQMLVVLDNARDAAHVRPLLPGTPTAVVVVTSRNQLTSLVAVEDARPLALNTLSTPEARQLLVARLGLDRVAAELDMVEAIIKACAGLPLALAIAAARAQTTGSGLADIATELTDARRRLDALDAGDASSQMRAVFSWSYGTLTPVGARLFRLLALQPGPDISAAAASSLAGQPAAAALAELVGANLLREEAPGRYTLHDLLRTYAADLTRDHDSDADRGEALTRLLDHYTHTAYGADRLLYPTRSPIPLPIAAYKNGVEPEVLTDPQEAKDWLTTELRTLLAALNHAANHGDDLHAWQLAWSLDTFLDRRGRPHDLAAAWQAALPADRRLPAAAEYYALGVLARAEIRLGHHATAAAHLQTALDLSTVAGDSFAQAEAHRVLASLSEQSEDPGRALDHAHQALQLYRAAHHTRGEAAALNAIGWYLCRLGDYAQALDYCQQALDMHRGMGDRYREAAALDSIGYAHHHLNDVAQAADCFRQAIALYREVGDRFLEADTLVHLGDTHQAAGDAAAARATWHHALAILVELDHPNVEAVRAKLERATA